jgi:hypothetical protein
MSKKKDKKVKKLKRMMREMQGYAAGANAGGLSSLLPKRRSDQFLLGLALGGAVAYVLGDEQLRGKIMRSGVKLYTSLMGGLEEMKEQMADIQAEMAAEQDGTA